MAEPVLRYATRSLGALVLSAVLALAGVAAPPDPVSGPSGDVVVGRPRVIDGDTLAFDEARVRLEGIDAPEVSQQCASASAGTWPCGMAAARRLSELIRDRDVRCAGRGHDRYGRALAVCFVGDVEINADLVRHGLAWAFVRYSRHYVEVEAEARAVRIGIWQAPTDPAWTYREKRWTASGPLPDASANCPIKGNITRQGRIYHMPWSPWYDKTRIDESKGERWFCSEGEATAAGWRPAHLW